MTDETRPTPESAGTGADPDVADVETEGGGEPVPGEEPGAGSLAGSAEADSGSGDGTDEGDGTSPSQDGETHPDTTLAAERLADLQRLQAEYVNYKRRVDRDRADIQIRATHEVLETLLPVLDEIGLAREHGDLDDGPFKAIADKLEQVLTRFGLERVGAKGEAFDPTTHEALMHGTWDASDEELPQDATSTTVVTVLQPGYRAGDRVLRPARVAVADPE